VELLRNWILCVTGSAVLAAVCLSIAPKGRVQKALQLICGLVTLLCLAYPVTSGDLGDLEGFDFDFTDTTFEEDARETERAVTRLVIEDEYSAYILDKGFEMGVEITSADVSVRWNDEGYWYPVRAEIAAPFESAELTQVISKELGLEPENIYWS